MEKINIAELLKDCPKGMELDCALYDNIVLDNSSNWIYPIKVTTKDGGTSLNLTKYGCVSENKNTKCVIFPKGKTTWKGFQRPFKDGDIVFYNDTIAIFKEWGDETLFRTYVTKYLCCDSLIDKNVPLYGKSVRKEIRFATEEEKQKLFQAIKDNGYEWNPETKTLEKLGKSRFHEGDWITDGVSKYQILFIDDIHYWYSESCILGSIESVDKRYHLWTINDAKDGDVLARNWHEGDDYWEKIVIFKKYHNEDKGVEGYGNTFKNRKLTWNEEVPYFSKTWTSTLQPATKEQSDFLFQKIKEAGYEWNAETKTLEKLPKFKIEKGKWYVCTKDLLDNYANKAFCKDDTYLSTQDGSLIPSNSNVPFEVVCASTYFRDWTINDAKDGDVLATSKGAFIYNGNKGGGSCPGSYCGINTLGRFQTGIEHHWTGKEVYPATKEQSDFLFQKIKEAGYKWNAETKTVEKLTIPHTPEKFYIRIGDIPSNEKSKIHKGDSVIGEEDGVSVYNCIKLNNTYHIVMPLPLKEGQGITYENLIQEITQCRYEIEKPRNVYLVSGMEIGKGHDNEPLIKNVKILKDLTGQFNTKNYNTEETNTLEKLPKFKVGDKIKYKNGKNIDGVEQGVILSITDDTYDVAVTNDMGVFVPITDQDNWELVPDIKPKFKVGDRIILKDNPFNISSIKIKAVTKSQYILENEEFFYISSADEKYVLEDKFNITTLKPFDKVLTRANDDDSWVCNLYSHRIKDYYVVLNAELALQCIPYEQNEHLLGTTDDCDEFYKTWK